MREIIYDVAVSLDGFIAAPGGDASAFPQTGPHADAYFERLGSYGTVIMGRSTYEFGYAFGLEPGARAYPHMDHHIFSTSLKVPEDADVAVIRDDWLAQLTALKKTGGAPIYLCGGGMFAGWVAQNGLVDRLILKRAPIVLGQGIRLFEGLTDPTSWAAGAVTPYDNGVTLLEYARA
ncbi:Dihydrofolate reductase [Aliiroseovarius halocynthiae]|uniref:Dihydrofolate reductase n=1 Tax=Aliiroseovarius halocynthiae TaxID=985055 RepID=A0A545SRN0_9RHOB|nr:dihydrofolate reductase family protein [Aliiroseovarius halocynthiae]TQV67635.1 dihydrofolate reductase [Aliiroseovarius halocynthiae]SMR81677.1 Dihydrofolate reductase [Aliiroseovarius halocynthiae]